jgi:lipopolysaccharide transport system ATP-binding protein
LNPEFTGLQNIYFNGTMIGFTRREMEEKIDDIVSFADIGDFIHQPLKTYSSGMKARLGFALAINMNPEILILDEVLSVGDELFRRKCYAKMEEFFKSGCTVLFVSHSVSAVNLVCSRAILLDRGELLLEGPSVLVTRYYHMLLYSSPADQNAVRNEIIQLNSNQEKKEEFIREIELTENDEKLPQLDDDVVIQANTTTAASKQKAYFIRGFEPKSTVVHKLRDVEIFDAQVQTLAGDKVNALVMNEVYIFSYKVKFHLNLDNVKFTMLIQDEKGLSISGVSIPEENNDEIQRVKNGETSLIQIKFKCIMLPGNYYISASVLHINENNEKTPLLRISDITVFKVQPLANSKYWGVLNLGQEEEITKLT